MPASQWADVNFDEPLFANADEAILSRAVAGAEGCYFNAAKGWSRFPLCKPYIDLPGSKTFLYEYRDDLIATTDQGRVYRVNRNGTAADVTGVPLAGGKRPTFDFTGDRMVMAAGGQILQLKGATTEVLSEQAPLSTHVVFVDSFLVAIEPFSGRFWYCDPGQYEIWNDLSVFAAVAKPDPVNAAIVTPYTELLISGTKSIEQYERLTTGDTPFYRRYTTGEGVYAPYTLIGTTDGNYGINDDREFVRFGGQISRPQSEAVDLVLEQIDDWSEAWAAKMSIKGQKFIILQMPNATNAYDTVGVTLLLDYRATRWTHLYGWDSENARPTRWPGWSYQSIWGRHFIGVEGGIAELEHENWQDCDIQRMLVRTGHMDAWGPSHIDRFRMRLKKNRPSIENPGEIGLRWNRDAAGWSPWVWRSMAQHNNRDLELEYMSLGKADMTWQFEIAVTDPTVVEFVKAQALVGRERS